MIIRDACVKYEDKSSAQLNVVATDVGSPDYG